MTQIRGQHLGYTLQLQAHVRAAQDLASGYMSGKLLLKLDSVAFILVNHTSKNFAFLDQAVNSRARTSFYHTLARLLFMEDTPAKFKAFVAPLQQVGSSAYGRRVFASPGSRY